MCPTILTIEATDEQWDTWAVRVTLGTVFCVPCCRHTSNMSKEYVAFMYANSSSAEPCLRSENRSTHAVPWSSISCPSTDVGVLPSFSHANSVMTWFRVNHLPRHSIRPHHSILLSLPPFRHPRRVHWLLVAHDPRTALWDNAGDNCPRVRGSRLLFD